MSQKISIRFSLKQILLLCITTIICLATLGLGLGLGFGTGRSDNPVEALQNENHMLPRGVTQVSGGLYHTMVIDSTGSLWAFGSNSYGQLGNMSTAYTYKTPINITTQPGNPLYGKQIVQVSAGGSHTLAIDSAGNLWAFGYNGQGELGNMSTTNSSTPINITAQSGNPLYGKQIIQVSASSSHTTVIDSQGSLWAFGRNNEGQLGNMTTKTFDNSTPINITAQSSNPLYNKQIVQISAGNNHTMAIDASGNLWAFGFNTYGKLGDMSTTYKSTPVNITAQAGNPLNGKQIVQVSTGHDHTMAIDAQGNLWAFGRGIYGQLGNMSIVETNSTPINITAQSGNPLYGKQLIQVSATGHTMTIDSSGCLWAFGSGNDGRLGNMETIGDFSTPTNITAQSGNTLNGKQVVQVSAGGTHTLAIDSTGNLWSFGYNSSGQLGDMTSSSASTPINITAQSGNPLNNSQFGRMQVSAGSSYTMAIDASGNLWSFGYNNSGQLGNMSTDNSSTPINITAQSGNPLNGKQIVQISATINGGHTMAIDSQGNLWTFGNNSYGQLGNMSTNNSSTPINITAQSGNPLNGKQIVQVSAGREYSMAIDSNGNLWAFGLGDARLGNMTDNYEAKSTPINLTAQSGNSLFGKQIVQVATGNQHTMAIDSQGNLWAFGAGIYGMLGNMSTVGSSNPISLTSGATQTSNPLYSKKIVQVETGYSHTVAIDSQGNLWAWGPGDYGQLGNMSNTQTNHTPTNITTQSGNPLNGKQIVQVSAGGYHTTIIDSLGHLWAFGQDNVGQLGNMSTTNSSTPINITAQSGNPLNGKQITQISAGYYQTMVIDAQGNLWSFGSGTYGQLGNMSTTQNNSTPINISTIAGTSATISGNPNARISVRTNFTTGWGTATASGGTFTNWTADTLSSPAIIKNNSTQTGRVRYEFDIGKHNTIKVLSINDIPVTDTSVYSSLKLFNNIIYLRILTSGTITIVEIDRINTKLFVPVTISVTTSRNVGHSFNFSNTSHLSSRMRVGSGTDTTSLNHIFEGLSWSGNIGSAAIPYTTFTFTSQIKFSKIIISRPSQTDMVITDFTNPIISGAGLAGNLFSSTGTPNTIAITLYSMEDYDYTWTIETYQQIQVQQILNPPAGATAIANPPLLTLNSSAGAGWADAALAAPANLFGKTFAGWYTHPTGGSKISSIDQLQQQIYATGGAVVFLYAHWA